MRYEKIVLAKFLSRTNRFVAQVELAGQVVSVHVKNTGRCKELLLPGATVYLEDFTNRQGKRKLLYDLIAVQKGNLLINMDAQAPNKVVKEALMDGKIRLPAMTSYQRIRSEVVYGSSRFDFYVEDVHDVTGFLEVKGVTLENNAIASFPDAPTERGVKHLQELIRAKAEGYQAYLLFVIQMAGMQLFMPNDACHAAFGATLREAAVKGVQILAYACAVTPNSLTLTEAVPIRL